MDKVLNIPNHIAFIMDGNGRWAKKRNKPRSFGHIKGAKNVVSVLTNCYKKGIKTVSLYALSTENLKRPKEEIDGLLILFEKFLTENVGTLIKNQIRFHISGDLKPLSNKLYKIANDVEEKTKNFTLRHLNVLINYGGRQELVRACNLLIESKKTSVTEEDLKSCLYSKDLEDVDLLVRTSGEERISNFMLYDIAYAELYFTDACWPDFNKKELDKALEEYSKRNRRFGKI